MSDDTKVKVIPIIVIGFFILFVFSNILFWIIGFLFFTGILVTILTALVFVAGDEASQETMKAYFAKIFVRVKSMVKKLLDTTPSNNRVQSTPPIANATTTPFAATDQKLVPEASPPKLQYHAQTTYQPKPKNMSVKKLLLIPLFLLIVIIGYKTLVVVGVGKTGVVSFFGNVRDQELSSGLHIVNPLASVYSMSIQTEQYTMSIAPGESEISRPSDEISALTKEGLEVSVDVTVLYRLEESKASNVYRDVGIAYVEKLVRPEIRGTIRNIISEYEAKDLYSEKRKEASQKMYEVLRDKLEMRGIVIEEAVIRNIQLPKSLSSAIEAKLASEQESQRYDFVLETERKEAERKIIEAQAQRDAQALIGENLSRDYLNYLYIKELKDREGTIYVPIDPSSGMPVFKSVQ